MKFINVIPIARGINVQSLSYFTNKPVSIGTIVRVPMRNKTIDALVISIDDVKNKKTAIKSSAYAIKKVDELKARELFSSEFMMAVNNSADYFLGTPGSVIQALVPKLILQNADKIASTMLSNARSNNLAKLKASSVSEKYILQADDEERVANYKNLVRESFARGASVLLITPTRESSERFLKILSKGIETFCHVLHGALDKKTFVNTWLTIIKTDHPILIIGTSLILSVPKNDIGTIIIERESSDAYKMKGRPFIDIRTFAEFLSSQCKANFIVGDTFLRSETIGRYQNNEFIELVSPKFRSLKKAKQHLIDMRSYKKNTTGSLRVISDELKEIIEHTSISGERLFIFTARKGLSPITLCNDCGTVVLCNNCSAPVVLHNSKNGDLNTFICHKCGSRRNADERCANCTSWKLTAMGVGLELLERQIQDHFSSTPLFKVEGGSTDTPKVADKVNKFYATTGSILIGTEVALNFLTRQIEYTAVASIDALFSLPDFRIHEKILATILQVRSLATENFLLQTRNVDEPIFEYMMRDNLINYYREELKVRAQYGYPPNTVLIKISREDKTDVVKTDMAQLRAHLADYKPSIYPAFTSTVKGKYRMNALLKIPTPTWPDIKLIGLLRKLPQNFAINVDPESIL